MCLCSFPRVTSEHTHYDRRAVKKEHDHWSQVSFSPMWCTSAYLLLLCLPSCWSMHTSVAFQCLNTAQSGDALKCCFHNVVLIIASQRPPTLFRALLQCSVTYNQPLLRSNRCCPIGMSISQSSYVPEKRYSRSPIEAVSPHQSAAESLMLVTISYMFSS